MPPLMQQSGEVDVTSADPYQLAQWWSTEVLPIERLGILAVQCQTHCFMRTERGTGTGIAGDWLLVNNQKMKRVIISSGLFDFLFGAS